MMKSEGRRRGVRGERREERGERSKYDIGANRGPIGGGAWGGVKWQLSHLCPSCRVSVPCSVEAEISKASDPGVGPVTCH